MHSRRDFLKRAAMLSGAAGFAAGVPESIQKAFAIEPAVGSTWKDAEHIVILMQENRSFDHSLGTLQGVRGFNDPRAIRQANGNSIFLQTSKNGETYAPWRLDIKDTKITWMGSIPHSRDSQVDAWNYGHHNYWIDAKKSHNAAYLDVPITMGHYTREDLPFYYSLADAFTVCDQHYCGVMSSTTPNRSLLWTGTVRSEQKPTSSVYMRNDQFRKLKWTTFPERLTDAGINWGVYQNELNVADMEPEAHSWLGSAGNVLEHFDIYNVHLTNASMSKLRKELEDSKRQVLELKAAPIVPSMEADQKDLIQQKEEHVLALQAMLEHGGSLSNLPVKQQELHARAFITNAGDPDYHSIEHATYKDGDETHRMTVPKGDVLHQFRKDVAEGTLPAISWLVPSGKLSDHPSHPWYGAWFVSEAVDILTSNPDVWKKTIFIVTYDENDGYFDHAPSYVAADPQNKSTGRASAGIDTALEYSYSPDEIAQGVKKHAARSGPIGLGYRVPMIIASPWSRGGWVNSQLSDQTSTIQFLEKFVKEKYGKDVRETNISAFRRTILSDLTSAFRPYDGTQPEVKFLKKKPFVESIEKAKFKETPANFRKLEPNEIAAFNAHPHNVPESTKQEPGTRPSCALPTNSYCEGDFIGGAKPMFALAMQAGDKVHGERSAGSPFNVYLRNTAQIHEHTFQAGGNNQNMFVATYVVKAGDKMMEGIPLKAFKDGKYEIDIHGPNGFFREFRGDGTPPPVAARCMYEKTATGLTGNVELLLRNTSAAAVTVTVADNSYKTGTQTKEIAAGQAIKVRVDGTKSRGWYDFTVQAKGSAMSNRYAGRVETGKASITDPLMGLALA